MAEQEHARRGHLNGSDVVIAALQLKALIGGAIVANGCSVVVAAPSALASWHASDVTCDSGCQPSCRECDIPSCQEKRPMLHMARQQDPCFWAWTPVIRKNS